jgi:hypothetical protein
MNKQAVSVTLAVENLRWLQAQSLARRSRSLSATLDQILSEARGRSGPARSVVGAVTVDESDPELLDADRVLRGLFQASLGGRPTPARPARTRRAPRG